MTPRIPSAISLTASALALGLFCLAASPPLVAQTTPYELKVETGSGLLAFTFKTARIQARVYLPDDLAPGEPFTATTEGPGNYTFIFAGQSAKASQGMVLWNVPGVLTNDASTQTSNDDAVYSLVLRDARGAEVARASVHTKPPAPPRASDAQFRLPKFLQAGAPAPALGPFDGVAQTTRILIDGKPALIVAESRRKAILVCPQVLGAVAYQIAKGGIRHLIQESVVTGQTRGLTIETRESGIAVTGLAGLQDDIPFTRGGQYFFLRAANVSAAGTYSSSRNLAQDSRDAGADGDTPPEPLRLVFPQTPSDDVALILHGIRQDHAANLRRLDFDPLPVLVNFLDDPDLGGDAAYAMLNLDPKAALPLLFESMPASGPNIQRIGLGWFLEHYGQAEIAASSRQAHAAALRLLNKPQTSRTDAIELALYAVGFTGNQDDFPVLEKNYQYRNGWPGLKRVQDASEAALARLGSSDHIARIRAELALPLRPNPTDAMRAGQSLQKAGFSGLAELLPAVCPHLNDQAITDIDVTWDPKFAAMSALNAIANHTSPLAMPRMKTVAEWQSFCADKAVSTKME